MREESEGAEEESRDIKVGQRRLSVFKKDISNRDRNKINKEIT